MAPGLYVQGLPTWTLDYTSRAWGPGLQTTPNASRVRHGAGKALTDLTLFALHLALEFDVR